MALSRSALIPATSPTSTDLFVVLASRPHDPTAVEEARARRPHHNPPSKALFFVGQASRLCPLGSAVTSPPAGWVGGYPRAPACHGVL
jgi:hypothetical protein